MKLKTLSSLLPAVFLFSSVLASTQAPATPAPSTSVPSTADAQQNTTAPSNGAAPSSAAPAQPPTQPGQPGTGNFTIQTTVRLVVLDMVVTDKQGNVIKDLKQSEIHVQEAGEPQTIQNFETPGAHTPDPQASIESTADLDRLAPRAPVNIILLDEFNTRFEDMAFARYSLKKYLDKAPGKLDTPTMLIAVSLDKFQVLRDYTQNKDEILSALDHHFAGNPWQQQQGAWVGERYATAFITLRRVAQATIGHRGHKNMIWIGRGFPSRSFVNAPIDEQNRVNSAVQSCVNILRDARITLYTIDPAGVMTNPGEYGGGLFNYDPFGGNYEFNALARATGGRTLYGRNDVNAEIGTAIQDGSSFYTLTYRPTSTSNDPKKFRRIVVSVDRPGLTVITREGYYPHDNSAPVKPFDPQNMSRRMEADLIAADTSTMVYDGVPLTLKQSPTDPDTYILHVDGKSLVWTPATDKDPRQAALIILVSTFDKKGKELKRAAKSITAKAPATVAPTGRLDRPLDISYKIDHDPKAVRARFVVRVVATSRMGTADAILGQPVASAPAP